MGGIVMDPAHTDESPKRKKPGPKPSSPRRNTGQFLPILSNKPEDIRSAIQEYIDGATLKQIGAKYGVTRQAIYGWLLGELGGEQHSALVTRALTARIAKGDETLDTADNPLDLQRGREQARNARLDLERRRSHLYGQKQELTGKDGGPLQVQIVRFGQTIEGETVSSTPNAALLPVVQPNTKPE